MKKSILFSTLLIIFFFFPLKGGISFAQEQDTKEKNKPMITWESVPGAYGYLIEMKNNNTMVISERTRNTYYEIDLRQIYLEPGKYQLRISSLDNNGEIASDSPWMTVTVKKSRDEDQPHAPKKIYFGIGLNFNKINGQWKDILNDTGSLSLYGSYFTSIKYLGIEGGIEYVSFSGKTIPKKVKSDLTYFSFDIGPLAHENFGLPVTFIAGIDLGMIYTNLKTSNSKSNITSIDISLMPQISARYSYYNVYIETGLGYKMIFYSGKELQTLRPFVRVGAAF